MQDAIYLICFIVFYFLCIKPLLKSLSYYLMLIEGINEDIFDIKKHFGLPTYIDPRQFGGRRGAAVDHACAGDVGDHVLSVSVKDLKGRLIQRESSSCTLRRPTLCQPADPAAADRRQPYAGNGLSQ